MKIAVLLSAYNGEKYIRQQIDSILAQDGDFTLDLWVRDDGSTDKTKEILDYYSDMGKLNWYTGGNLGPAYSFIDLVKHCERYDFYAFSDQDDFWMPSKVKCGIEKIRKYDVASLYVGNAQLVDCNLNPLGRRVYKKRPPTDFFTLSCAGGLLGCTMIFNNELAKLIQKYAYPPKMVMHDFYLAELCAAVDGKIIYDPVPQIKYRQHESNVVGVSHGLLDTIRARIDDIRLKPKVSIAEQAESLLSIHEINGKKKKWLLFIKEYRTSIYNRIKLAFTSKISFINKNNSITLRVCIFLGNR